MEPIFQVETAHNEDAYNNMVTTHYMLHQKNSVKLLYVLAAALGVLVWWFSAAGNYASIGALGGGIMTLAIAFLAVPYVDRFSAQQVCRRMKQNVVKAAKKSKIYGIPTRYRFYEDRLDASDGSGCVETAYSRVTDLVETEGYYLIFIDNGQCILARKTDFTVGDPEGFTAFMEKACSRKMTAFEMPKRRRR